MITDTQKQENYVKLKIKLKKAVSSRFWFEACMIQYAIIEDRTSSILYHSGVCEDAYSPNKMLSNKLNSIEHQIGKEHPIISKKVNPEIIRRIKEWKDRRNDIVHRACIRVYDEAETEQVALEGSRLVDLICNESKKVSRLANKLSEARGKEM